MDPTTMQCAGIQKGGRSGPNMRSTTRAPSALALHSAAWPSAGTCPAELGEGRLPCDLTWVSDHWGDACRVIWHGPVITGLLWLGLSSDHWGRRLSCDLTWTNDRRWIRNKDLLDVGVDRLFDINTYVCTSRFPFSGEQTNPDEPRQGCQIIWLARFPAIAAADA